MRSQIFLNCGEQHKHAPDTGALSHFSQHCYWLLMQKNILHKNQQTTDGRISTRFYLRRPRQFLLQRCIHRSPSSETERLSRAYTRLFRHSKAPKATVVDFGLVHEILFILPRLRWIRIHVGIVPIYDPDFLPSDGLPMSRGNLAVTLVVFFWTEGTFDEVEFLLVTVQLRAFGFPVDMSSVYFTSALCKLFESVHGNVRVVDVHIALYTVGQDEAVPIILARVVPLHNALHVRHREKVACTEKQMKKKAKSSSSPPLQHGDGYGGCVGCLDWSLHETLTVSRYWPTTALQTRATPKLKKNHWEDIVVVHSVELIQLSAQRCFAQHWVV